MQTQEVKGEMKILAASEERQLGGYGSGTCGQVDLACMTESSRLQSSKWGLFATGHM